MEPLILEGVNEEVESFKRENRPYWPNIPTPCPVDGCSRESFSSFTSFQRHWSVTHTDYIHLYICSCCQRRFGRKDNAKAHMRKEHKLSLESMDSVEERNNRFIDPKDVQPFVVDQRSRLRAKRHAQPKPGLALQKEDNALCRDEEMVMEADGSMTKRFKSSKNI